MLRSAVPLCSEFAVLRCMSAIASIVVLALPRHALAIDKFFVGGNNASFSTFSNWSTGSAPFNGDRAFVKSGASVNYDDSYIDPGLLLLDVDGNAGSNTTLVQSANNTLQAVGEYVGEVDKGTYTQSNGTNIVGAAATPGAIYIGKSAGGVGNYNLSGGTLAVLDAGTEYIGESGTGAFTQTGGVNGSPGTTEIVGDLSHSVGIYSQSAGSNTVLGLVVGAHASAVGSQYILSGTGSLTSSFTTVADGGELASFIQNSGTHITTTLSVGRGPTGLGTYTLSGGTLQAGMIKLGYYSNNLGTSGNFTQSGGTSSADSLQLGIEGSGSYVQTGGTNSISGITSISGNGRSIYSLQGGTLTSGTINLLFGTFDQTGGSLDVPAFNQTAGVVTGTLQNQGTYTYSGGTFSGRLLNQGTVVLNADFAVGNGMENDTSVAIASGRTATLNGAGLDNHGIFVVASGGILNVNGSGLANEGTFTVAAGGTLNINGPLNNNAQMTANQNLTLSSPSTNTGTIELVSGYILSLNATTLSNAGAMNLNGSLISGSGTFNNNSGGVVAGVGTIASTFANSGGLLLVAGNTNVIQTFANSGEIQLTNAAANLAGGAINNTGSIQGAGNVSNAISNSASGTIEAVGGTLTIGNLSANSGLIAALAGNKLLVTSGLASNAGIINLTGGTFDNNGQALDNSGQITGYGVFRSGGLTNHGSIMFSGSGGPGTTTINGPVANISGKTINVKYQPAIFTGNVTNNGTFKITSTTVTFAGTYTGNVYISDPSDNFFQADVTVVAGGTMTGTSGDRFFMSGGNWINHGAFNNGGVLQSSDAIVSDGAFTQTGTLTQSANFTNSGTAVLGGTQNWSTGASFTNSAGSTRFQSDAGSATASTLTLNITGGAVTFAVPEHLAALSVAGSPAQSSIDFELASPASFGKAIVAGALTAGGTLGISLVSGFQPIASNSFDILDWGSLSGSFSTIQLPALGGGLAWNTSQLYVTGVLGVVSAGLPGDYDGNGVVDTADYVVWRKNQGTTHTLLNDPIGGTIGTAQYNQWRAHFGQPQGSGAGAMTNAAVPEPATLVLLMFAPIGWCFRRGRAA